MNLKTVFPVLQLAEICCINICEFFYLEKWHINHKLTLLHTYQAWTIALTIWKVPPGNIKKSQLSKCSWIWKEVEVQPKKTKIPILNLRTNWKIMSEFEFHCWKLREFTKNKAGHILNLMDEIFKVCLSENDSGKSIFYFEK